MSRTTLRLTGAALASSAVLLGLLVPTAQAATTSVAATTTVNIRSGPGLDRAIIGRLERGQQLPAVAGLTSSWVTVRFNGGTAYVKRSYLDTAGKLPAAPTKIDLSTPKVTTTALNVRTGAGPRYGIVAVAPEGTRLVTTGKAAHGYVQIRWASRQRWVSMQFLATVLGSTAQPAPPSLPSSKKGDIALAYAKKQLGKPYKFGATGPKSFDCSGLTLRAWQAAGVNLPRTSQQQFKVGTKITKSQLRPGDLVFFYGSRPSHVAIYVGNGIVVHSPRPGKKVQYIKLSYMPYSGARRPG